jgi:hypothetical protein
MQNKRALPQLVDARPDVLEGHTSPGKFMPALVLAKITRCETGPNVFCVLVLYGEKCSDRRQAAMGERLAALAYGMHAAPSEEAT